MKIKNVLFDLDGTIINPKVGITESIRYTLRVFGFEGIPEQDDLLWCIGPPLRESFSIMLKTEDKAEIDEAVKVYRSNYNREGIFQLKLYDGIVETIKTLKNEGFNVYIATSKPRVMAVRIIDHLSLTGLFEGIYGAELDGTRNRKGDLISYLLKQEIISSDETIMIGDRKHDIIGAVDNGILSCGVTYGFGSKEELLNAGADFLVQKPDEILNHIFKLLDL